MEQLKAGWREDKTLTDCMRGTETKVEKEEDEGQRGQKPFRQNMTAQEVGEREREAALR